MEFTPETVLALAPDDASAKAVSGALDRSRRNRRPRHADRLASHNPRQLVMSSHKLIRSRMWPEWSNCARTLGPTDLSPCCSTDVAHEVHRRGGEDNARRVLAVEHRLAVHHPSVERSDTPPRD